MKLIGFRESSFQPKDSNERIEGFNLYFAFPEDNVTGEACERVFLSKKKMDGYVPKLGDKIGLVYNRYGKVDRLDVG